MELPEIADIVARWAARFDRLETVYIFGSRVHGGHPPSPGTDGPAPSPVLSRGLTAVIVGD